MATTTPQDPLIVAFSAALFKNDKLTLQLEEAKKEIADLKKMNAILMQSPADAVRENVKLKETNEALKKTIAGLYEQIDPCPAGCTFDDAPAAAHVEKPQVSQLCAAADSDDASSVSSTSSKPIIPTSKQPCKYGAKCTRPGCHFAHPPCPDGNNCTRPECNGTHPMKLCRFGMQCRNIHDGCTFRHVPGVTVKPKHAESAPRKVPTASDKPKQRFCPRGRGCPDQSTCPLVHAVPIQCDNSNCQRGDNCVFLHLKTPSN